MRELINQAYGALSDFREQRRRYKRFTYGHQWDDLMVTPKGEKLTEGEYACRNGRVPMTNNMVHRLVKTLVGHFRTNEEGKETVKADHNHLEELDARMFEEFLISGCAIQRVGRERRPGTAGELTWVDNVVPDSFFCYPLRDPRGIDAEVVGQFHDMGLAEALGRFASGSRERARQLEHELRAGSTGPSAMPRCRITEVWLREAAEQLRCHDRMTATLYSVDVDKAGAIQAMNRRRQKRGEPRIEVRYEVATRWVGRWFTDSGMELRRTVAQRHPYVVKFYPLIDGEIHSYVSGVIDQQKYINRLLTVMDNIMSTSAKGVLLFPADELPEEMEWSDVQERWAQYDSIIPYLPRAGSPGPHQVVGNGANCGAAQMLDMELRLFEQVSGVSGALQGSGKESGSSAQLFDAQTRNSLAAVADIFKSFNDFRRQRDEVALGVRF